MNLRFIKGAFLLVSVFTLSACSGGGGGGGGSTTPSAPNPTWSSYSYATPADLPACSASISGELAYVQSTTQFETCNGSAWSVVNVNNRFTAGIICQGQVSGLAGAAGTALNGLIVDYKAYVTSAGDVMAEADVMSSSLTIGTTTFYAASQVGASTGAVIFVDDFATPNGGFWNISTNRSTLVVTAVYTDNSLGGQSPVTLTFLSSACTLNNF